MINHRKLPPLPLRLPPLSDTRSLPSSSLSDGPEDEEDLFPPLPSPLRLPFPFLLLLLDGFSPPRLLPPPPPLPPPPNPYPHFAQNPLPLLQFPGRLRPNPEIPPIPLPPDAEARLYRALARVLSAMSRIPVRSRKYALVRSLADHLIRDNARCGAAPCVAANRAALAGAMEGTVKGMEAAMGRGRTRMGEGRLWGRLRRWAEEEGEDRKGGEEEVVEKKAAEAMWIAERMAECGAGKEAVEMWGGAAGLGRMALAAGPRVQAALVKVSAFLFKRAKDMDIGKREEERAAVACSQMRMLTSWLPLLCSATNGIDAPVLSSLEREDLVRVLDQIIDNLDSNQQEEVLTLWLQYYSSCPHSDWPDLQMSYVRWYNKSRKLLS